MTEQWHPVQLKLILVLMLPAQMLPAQAVRMCHVMIGHLVVRAVHAGTEDKLRDPALRQTPLRNVMGLQLPRRLTLMAQ